MRVILSLLAILLLPLPVSASPLLLLTQGGTCLPSVLHEVTITALYTGSYVVPTTWYSDSCLRSPGAQMDLDAGGGGGAYGLYGNGIAGDNVVAEVAPSTYAIYVGQGGAGGSSVGATVTGGAGYVAGANGTSYGAGAGSSAILNFEETVVIAQAKGGNSAGGQLGGGTSSGGTVYAQGGAAGGTQGGIGFDGNPGGNGAVVVRYYTAP